MSAMRYLIPGAIWIAALFTYAASTGSHVILIPGALMVVAGVKRIASEQLAKRPARPPKYRKLY